MDFDKKRVSLSMKALLDAPVADTADSEPVSIDDLAAAAETEE